jgi:hypothetical protein
MLYKDDWDKSKERFKALWNREIVDRCCVSVTSPKRGCKYPAENIPDNYIDLVKYWTDPELVIKRNVERFENTFFGGDSFPNMLIDFGPEAQAAYFGAKYKFDKRTVWFEPIIEDWEKDRIEFDVNNEFYQKHRAYAKYLAEEGKGKFFVSMSDNASAADTLAFLRGSENLLMDFVVDKENVKRAMKTILQEWLYTEREFFEISKECNEGGSCVGWLNTWAPGYHSFIQSDISVMISPQTFEEFMLEDLKTMSNSLDRSIYHFDGIAQIRHLDMQLSIERLDMIQWMNCDAQLPSSGYIPELKKIQAAGKCLHLFCQPYEVEILLTELSSKGLYLVVVNADSEDEAREIVKLAEKLTKE